MFLCVSCSLVYGSVARFSFKFSRLELNREALARFSSRRSRPPSSSTSPAVKQASQRRAEHLFNQSQRRTESSLNQSQRRTDNSLNQSALSAEKESLAEGPSTPKAVSSLGDKVQRTFLDKNAVLYPPARTAAW